MKVGWQGVESEKINKVKLSNKLSFTDCRHCGKIMW